MLESTSEMKNKSKESTGTAPSLLDNGTHPFRCISFWLLRLCMSVCVWCTSVRVCVWCTSVCVWCTSVCVCVCEHAYVCVVHACVCVYICQWLSVTQKQLVGHNITTTALKKHHQLYLFAHHYFHNDLCKTHTHTHKTTTATHTHNINKTVQQKTHTWWALVQHWRKDY